MVNLKRVFFVLLFLFVLNGIAGCENDIAKVKAGEGITDKENTRGFDGFLISKPLPPSANNIKYLGGGWITFSIGNKCFLLADHGRGSALSNYECD